MHFHFIPSYDHTCNVCTSSIVVIYAAIQLTRAAIALATCGHLQINFHRGSRKKKPSRRRHRHHRRRRRRSKRYTRIHVRVSLFERDSKHSSNNIIKLNHVIDNKKSIVGKKMKKLLNRSSMKQKINKIKYLPACLANIDKRCRKKKYISYHQVLRL